MQNKNTHKLYTIIYIQQNEIRKTIWGELKNKQSEKCMYSLCCEFTNDSSGTVYVLK